MQVKELNSGYHLVQLSKLSQSSKIPIPNTWEVKKLKDIAEINPGVIDVNYSNDKILYIDIGSIERFEIQKYEHFDLNKRPSRAQRIVKKNDIIVSTVRPYLKGFTKISDSKPNLICSTGFAVLRPRNSDDADFIFNYVKSPIFDVNIIRHMEGMAYPAVTSKMVEDSLIPYPTNKNERLKIGYIFLNLNDLIQKTDQIIEQTQKLKKGLMQKLLTKGIGHTRFKKVKYVFGRSIEIPENWKVVKVNDITQSIVPGRNKPRRFVGDIPWITISDLDSMYVNDSKNGLRITKEEVKQNAGKIIPQQSVIMTCVGEFGIVGIASREMVLNQQLHAFICSEYILPYFLAISLMLQKKYMYSIATTTTIPYMNKDNCESIPIILPPVSEQKKMISTLSSLESKITKDQKSRRGIEKIKNGLMQKLLTGKIRVKI